MTTASAGSTITYSKAAGATMNWVQDGGSVNPQFIHNGAGASNQNVNFSNAIGSGVTLQVNGTSTGTLFWNGITSGSGGMNINKAGVFVTGAAHTFTTPPAWQATSPPVWWAGAT
jgi:hypothetical protein